MWDDEPKPRTSAFSPSRLLFLFVIVVLTGTVLVPVDRTRLRPPSFEPIELVDRTGRPLDASLQPEAVVTRWVSRSEISSDLEAAILATQDRRFQTHLGLDMVAIARFVVRSWREGRWVGGASTISQQVARLILDDEEQGLEPARRVRAGMRKLLEAHLALRLERAFSKSEILEAWVNRLPVEGVGVGLAAASERLLGRSIASLDAADAALLVASIRASDGFDPDRPVNVVARERRDVLLAMAETGYLTPEQMSEASLSPVFPDADRPRAARSRLAGWAISEDESLGHPFGGRITTTLDSALSERVRTAVVGEASIARGPELSWAAVVIDHRSDEIRVLTGGAPSFDHRWGTVVAPLALRPAGNALDPFVYLAALESGRTLSTPVADVEQAFADLRGSGLMPENADRQFHGPVRLREALSRGYAVAAADVTRSVGLRGLAGAFERAGVTSLPSRPDSYGPGLTLRELLFQPLEIAEAYAVLARGGIRRAGRLIHGSVQSPPQRAFDERLVWLVNDALAPAEHGESDRVAHASGEVVRCGRIRGTREVFCAGFDGAHAAVVWLDGVDDDGEQRVRAAWREVMLLARGEEPASPPAFPDGLVRRPVCALSGDLPGPDCPTSIEEWFAETSLPTHSCAMHRKVRLARLDGLPVPDGCDAPAGAPVAMTLFPAPFDAWAVDQMRGLPDVVSEGCRTAGLPEGPPQLVLPPSLEVLRYDPQLARSSQRMLLRVAPSRSATPVRFSVDGVQVEEQLDASSALWNVAPGYHRITARYGADGPESEPRIVVVR